MNKTILRGFVGQDPDVYSGNDKRTGKPYLIVRFSIAINFARRDAEGNVMRDSAGNIVQQAEWWKIKTEGELAQKVIDRGVKKGSNVLLEGFLRQTKYMGKAVDEKGQPILYGDGRPVMVQKIGTEIVGTYFEHVSAKNAQENAYAANSAAPVQTAVQNQVQASTPVQNQAAPAQQGNVQYAPPVGTVANSLAQEVAAGGPVPQYDPNDFDDNPF